MNVQIEQLDLDSDYSLIREAAYSNMTQSEQATMESCLKLTKYLWGGSVDGEIACIWGLIPPSLLSYQAYLWLYTNELVKEHTFVFVRYSQLAVAEMLKEFTTIVGHCIVGQEQSIRWLKWLGAEFGAIDGKKIPFIIKAK